MKNQSHLDSSSDTRQDIGVVVKVMGLSIAIALWIKYMMPAFPIPATSSIALVAILLPSTLIALILKFKAN